MSSTLSLLSRWLLFGGAALSSVFLLYRAHRRVGRSAAVKITSVTRQLFSQYERYVSATASGGSASGPLSDEDVAARLVLAQSRARGDKPSTYRCIEQFRFAEPRITWHSLYQQLIVQAPDKQRLKYVDLGCCFGTDLRQALLDGLAVQNVTGIDISPTLIQIGYETLFNDEAFLAGRFIIANVLEEDVHRTNPALAKLVAEGIDVIYCGSVYHLLTQQQTDQLTFAVSKIMKGGGTFFGRTIGSSDEVKPIVLDRAPGDLRFLHSIETFTAMFKRFGFTDIKVEKSVIDMPVEKNEAPQRRFITFGDGQTCMLSFSARLP